MATLSSPQQSKYASFEPEQPEEEQTQVDSLLITFEDLSTGKARTQEVFCDPESWRPRSDLRFLISSDLVNLLTESHLTRKARAKSIHEKLAQCRAAFLCDLWRLRGLADRLLRADIEEENPQCLQLNDVCSVHYYVPELYFDDWTQHRLNKANHGFEAKIKSETNQLKDYLIRLGGGTWKNLLWYALRFNTVMEVGKQLMDSIKDEAKRKHIENMVTGGLWDKMDQLTPIVEVLDATMEEFESNQEEFEKENVAQVQAIEFCTKRKIEVEDLIEAEDPQLPPDSDTDLDEEPEEEEEEDDAFAEYKPTEEGEDPELLSMIAAATSSGKKAPSKLEVETMKKKLKQKRQAEEKAKKQEQQKQEEERLQQEQIQRMLEVWEEKAKTITEELSSLEAPLQQLEVETMEQLGDEVKRPEQAARLLEERAAEMEKNAQKAARRAEELEAQVLKAEQQVSSEQGMVKELQAQVKDLPPPDPRILIFSQLKLELKRLTREVEPRKTFIKQVKDRIKAIRYEMRNLYQKLGWDWDLSESEDDGEEKPYWFRRKMAIDGPLGFDERKFLYNESDFKGRRLKKRTMKERSRVESSLVAQLQAKGRTRINNIEGMEERNKILPFAANEGRDIIELEDVLSRSKGSKKNLRQQQDDVLTQGSIGGYPRTTNQALCQQLLDVAKERLKMSLSCFINLLPEEGQLHEFRSRAAELNSLSDEALQTDEQDDVERTLEELVAAFQGLIGEALGLSSTDAFVSVLQHSFDFGELRKRISEVHTSQKQLQLALRCTTAASSKSRTNAKPALRHARTQGDLPAHRNPQDLSSFILASPRLKLLETVGEQIAGGTTGSDGSLAKRKDESRQVTDLGFALNGTAQGSLEKWSHFKVNKRSGEESASSSAAGSTRTAAQAGENSQVPDSKTVRLRRATTDYDFKDYMAQLQDGKELARNSSLPSLRPQLRKGPSLPELIRKGSASELVCQERKGQRLRHSVTTSAIDASAFSKFFTASRW